MPLVPKQEQPEGQPKTRAGKLRALHATFSKQESRQADFSKLLKRYSFEDIERVLKWLAKQSSHYNQISSGNLILRFAHFREQCDQDLSEYPVTQEAHDVLEQISQIQTAEPIPVEYVQHAIDEYRKITQWLATESTDHLAELLADKLLPAKEFVYLWFTRIVPVYSKKFRKFDLNHPKFQQMMLKFSQEVGSPRAWISFSVAIDAQR